MTLPQSLATTALGSLSWQAFRAAQVKLDDLGFLSRDIKVRDLIENRSDVHHIFPKDFLKKAHLEKDAYNQVANYAITQTEINITIANRAPQEYFGHLLEQVNGGKLRYGSITDLDALRENLKQHCIPDGIQAMTVENYPAFLAERRRLMAQKIRTYFMAL